MAEKYCSTCFKTGEELDAALTKALECNDNAERAEAAAELAVKSASVAEESADIAEESKAAAERAKEDAEQARNEAQAIAGGEYLTLAGGTVTGPITLPGNPVKDLHAAPKQYVDAKILYGTEDLEAGVTPLKTGTLYVVYE